MSDVTSEQPLIERLVDEFLERQRAGDKPTIDEYCRQYPDLEEQIRSFFPALMLVEDLKPDSNDVIESISDDRQRDGKRLERVGEYRIIREVGRGGMGVVYEAEQESLKRRVALKVLPRQRSGDEASLLRFQREARAAARMHHTNIVPVFDVGEDEAWVFYAMQLIQGQGLDLVVDDLRRLRTEYSVRKSGSSNHGTKCDSDRVPENSIAASLVLGRFQYVDFTNDVVLDEPDSDSGPDSRPLQSDSEALRAYAETVQYTADSTKAAALPGQSELSSAETNRRAYFQSVARIGLQTARALAYAHARGIIHRDIKPSNLLLDTTGTVWVTDFGLAKTGEEGITHTGDILGTIRYMSPERFRGQCDVRADVYALGLTMYELLALEPAFSSRDRLKLIDRIQKSDPPSLRVKDPGVPRDLETIIFKCIDKDPKRRYQSADELADDLQRFIDDAPIQARRVGVVERFTRWARRNRGLAISLTVLSAVLIVAAAGSSVAAIHFNTVANQREVQRRKAQQEQDKADAARRKEAKQRMEAEAARKAEAIQRHRAERALNAARIALSENALNAEDAMAAGQILDKSRPVKGAPDRRQWEWYYLRHIANAELHSFRPHVPVYALAVSPDGRFVASSGGGDIFRDPGGTILTGQVAIQDLKSGKIAHVLRGIKRRVHSLAYSPDGRRLATAGANESVRIWSTENGKTLRTIKTGNKWVHRVRFSRDGGTLVIAGSEGIQVLNAQTGKRTRSFSGIYFALGVEGKRLFVADGKNKSIRIVDVATGKETGKWPARIGRMAGKPLWGRTHPLAVSPSGRHVAVLVGAVDVDICDAKTGKMIQRVHHAKGIRAMAFSTDGKQLATGGSDFIVRLWDVATGKQQAVLFGHPARISDLAFTSNGRRLVSADFAGYVKVWDPRRNPRHAAFQTRLSHDSLADVTFTGDGAGLRAVGRSGKIANWDAAGARQPGRLKVRVFEKPSYPRYNFSFSSDGRRLAAPTRVPNVAGIWDANSGKPLATLKGHAAPIVAVAWSHDGDRVATGDFSGVVKLWDAANGKQLGTFLTHDEQWGPLAISPDKRVLAMAGFQSVVLWDVKAGRLLRRLPLAKRSSVMGLAFSADGTRLAAADSNHNTVVVWDPAEPERHFTLPAPKDVSCVAFSPRDNLLAAIGVDGEVRLWDSRSGNDLLILRPDVPPVNFAGWTPRVVFSRDGTKIAANSWNGTFTIWSAKRKWTKTTRLPVQVKADAEAETRFELQLLLKDIATLMKQRPKNAVLRIRYASLLSYLGRQEEAVAAYRQAIKLDPKQSGAHNGLAWLLVTTRDKDGEFRNVEEGLRLAQTACRLAPDDASHWNTLGVARYRNNKWPAALEALQKSDRLKRDQPINWIFLAMTQWRLGDKTAAGRWYDKALAWRAKNKPDAELASFFREAADLMGR